MLARLADKRLIDGRNKHGGIRSEYVRCTKPDTTSEALCNCHYGCLSRYISTSVPRIKQYGVTQGVSVVSKYFTNKNVYNTNSKKIKHTALKAMFFFEIWQFNKFRNTAQIRTTEVNDPPCTSSGQHTRDDGRYRNDSCRCCSPFNDGLRCELSTRKPCRFRGKRSPKAATWSGFIGDGCMVFVEFSLYMKLLYIVPAVAVKPIVVLKVESPVLLWHRHPLLRNTLENGLNSTCWTTDFKVTR